MTDVLDGLAVFLIVGLVNSGTHDVAGQLLARRWHGEAANTGLTEALSGYGFVYYIGAVYYMFGRNQLFVQLLNATIGSLTVLVVYAIGRRLFGREVGRWSGPTSGGRL